MKSRRLDDFVCICGEVGSIIRDSSNIYRVYCLDCGQEYEPITEYDRIGKDIWYYIDYELKTYLHMWDIL